MMLDILNQLSQLPAWLSELSDAERVSAALQYALPAALGGMLQLERVKPKRFRLKRGAWTATYEVAVAPKDERPDGHRSMLLLGHLHRPDEPPLEDIPSDGQAGEHWRRWVPELHMTLQEDHPDAALDSIGVLTDPDAARTLLETALRSGSPRYSDIAIQGCTPKVVRDKPGSRCTLVYQLDYPSEARRPEWPPFVVAKAFRAGKGRDEYDIMRAVWSSGLDGRGVVSLAEPLAFVSDLSVLVQGPIPHEASLRDVIKRAVRTGTTQAVDEARRFVAKSAAGLAALHTSGVEYGEVVTWDDEVAEIREVARQLAPWIPEVAEAVEPLLTRLEGTAGRSPAQSPVPAHGSFRPDQVLINGESVGFIDFDGACRAEPALDVAQFRTTVKNTGARIAFDALAEDGDNDVFERRLDIVDDLTDGFLTEYSAHAPLSQERVVMWETLDFLTRVLDNWTKVRPERLEGTIFLLQRHLQQSRLGDRPS
jgi:Phosphotransferase enzyme family